ncbi:hypothetical protein F0562_013403 [Nyssa sinensis]|uniref:Uncharacterized protein n=1 Tax=Nyssa sinensis TaxID=561372 RepID=A0A5J4ZK32_9ASTE|nr:hypothetical protein F0562_013403 [Nyssa sinensis]
MASGTVNEALKDIVSSLDNFICVPEGDGAVALSVQAEQHTIELVDLQKILNDFMTETSARITNIMEDVVSLTDIMKINLKCLEDDVVLVKNKIFQVGLQADVPNATYDKLLLYQNFLVHQ